MLHKYLPRVGAGVLASVAGTALPLVIAACGDPAGPGPNDPLALTLDVPAGDSVAQLGVRAVVTRRDSTPAAVLRVWVDSAAGGLPAYTLNATGVSTSVLVFVPGPGRHAITAALDVPGGVPVSRSVTRTFALPQRAYAVAALPDLGFGGGAEFVHANGTVTGWVATAGGRRQGAVWRGGVLSVVETPDTLDVVATRVNAAGDVLLRVGPAISDTPATSVWVLRADGARLQIGPLRSTIVLPPPGLPRDVRTCCERAADLNERREAVAGPQSPTIYPNSSAIFDVAAGRLTDTLSTAVVALNDRGQRLSERPDGGYLLYGLELPARPFRPETVPLPWCVSGHPVEVAYGLDNTGAVLTSYCSVLALRSASETVWLDTYLGDPRQALLARDGGMVAAKDWEGRLLRWSATTRRGEQLRLADGAWRVESVTAVNGAGAISAYGTNAATGRAAALLLTPAAP